jgi:metal-responsive CopG/Arc/MetJ family transcriptional regulator
MCYNQLVRTTVDLDDDLLQVAKQLARQRGATLSQVISELARQALEPKTPPRVRNGALLFTPKPGAKKPHLALVNQLRDEP